MSNSLGTVGALMIVLFFIALVSGYMAFNVNYTKAFRMMNKVIDVYNDHNGVCDGSCKSEIYNYASNIGYHPHALNCSDIGSVSGANINNLYCEYRMEPDYGTEVYDGRKTYYYRISTLIDINIPTINKFLNLRVLSVTGDTEVYRED